MFGLSPATIHSLHQIFSKYPEIESAAIFGSRAKGNFREGSDIDIALNGSTELPQRMLRLKSDLDESALPYRVDLVYLPDIRHAELLDHIRRFGQKFYP
jgi:predicted nucleotidyltransferase